MEFLISAKKTTEMHWYCSNDTVHAQGKYLACKIFFPGHARYLQDIFPWVYMHISIAHVWIMHAAIYIIRCAST